jgi:hypothetical protein
MCGDAAPEIIQLAGVAIKAGATKVQCRRALCESSDNADRHLVQVSLSHCHALPLPGRSPCGLRGLSGFEITKHRTVTCHESVMLIIICAHAFCFCLCSPVLLEHFPRLGALHLRLTSTRRLACTQLLPRNS